MKKLFSLFFMGVLVFLMGFSPVSASVLENTIHEIESQLRAKRKKTEDEIPLKGFFYICAYGRYEEVKKALDAGADPHAGNPEYDNLPPLAIAAAYNPDPKVIETLLLAGVNVNQVSGKDKRTALHFALMTNSQADQIVEALLAADPDIYAQDRFFYTPIDFAVSGNYRDGAFDANPREDLILLLLSAAERLPFTMQRGDRKSFMTKKLQQYDINMGYGWRDKDVVNAFIRLGADERIMKDR